MQIGLYKLKMLGLFWAILHCASFFFFGFYLNTTFGVYLCNSHSNQQRLLNVMFETVRNFEWSRHIRCVLRIVF